jgi:hypothetical protein
MPFCTVDELRKVNILLINRNAHLFSCVTFPLEKIGCRCFLAESHHETSELISHAKLDLVLSLSSHQGLRELMTLFAGLRVSMFHMLTVEEGWWWLPVIRNGEKCLDDPAFPPGRIPSCSY